MRTVLAWLMPMTFVGMLVVERVFPARPLPPVRGWVKKGVLFFVLLGALSMLPSTALRLLGPLPALVPLHPGILGDLEGGLAGFAAVDLVLYGLHRLMHNVPFLWRWTHQMHHSAERVDVAGSVYSHPLDVALFSGTSALVLVAMGLGANAAAVAGFLGFLAMTFQHLNVRTPRWLGWFVQRPEAHAIHHLRGVHAYNYGSLTLWDILFGTFRNPRAFTADPAGFWDGASEQVGSMLIGRDVSDPPA
jgi:sterol desaturase/sphingolipid hydroxylase (fatty acid hydroxylase superfamily)